MMRKASPFLITLAALMLTACDVDVLSTPVPTPTATPIIAIMPTVNNPDIGNINADQFTPGAVPVSTGNPGVTITPSPLPTEVSFPMQFTASDGLVIAATYYGAAKRPAPGVLLLHMLGGRKEDWSKFAILLNMAGYNVLAIDLRGHGMTGGDLDWTKAPGDVKSVIEQFRVLSSMLPDKIYIVGASIGANLALNVCADVSVCKATVLLSPGLDYEGIQTADAMARYGARPVLIVASKDDSPSAKDSAALDKIAKGDQRLQIYAGLAHGTALFDAHADLAGLIIQWLAAHTAS